MELVGVGHGTTAHDWQKWNQWAKDLDIADWHVLDTSENVEVSAANNLHQIPNTSFEFGAYAAARDYVRGSGPYLLVNDTLFKTHVPTLWRKVLRQALGKPWTAGIIGDATPSPNTQIPEIPHPYYSSWIFLIKDRGHLDRFCTCVEAAIKQPPSPASPQYTRFLKQWLEPKSKWYGWHGPKDVHSLQRKRQTIAWEHTLSHALAAHGIVSFSVMSAWHLPAQWADKFRRHWASFAKS